MRKVEDFPWYEELKKDRERLFDDIMCKFFGYEDKETEMKKRREYLEELQEFENWIGGKHQVL